MPRGKKTCPKCKAEVGPRLFKCECGFNFPPVRPKTRKPTITPSQPPITDEELSDTSKLAVKVTSRDAFLQFVNSMNECYADSHRTGGCYSAFLHHSTGVLRVEVSLTMVLR